MLERDAPDWSRVEGVAVCADAGPDATWVTMLHSLATDSDLWSPQVAALSGRHRILRLDFPGHGGSPVLAPLTIESLARKVLAVWDALGIARSHVVGLSLGGMTALELALIAPSRMLAVIAADCRADAPPAFRQMWSERQARVRAGGLAAVLEETLASWLTPSTQAERPELVAEVREMVLRTSVDGYLAATTALQGLDIKPRLAGVRPPVWFLCGEADGPHPQEMRDMAAHTPASTFIEIPGAAHLSNLEQPDGFNAAMLAALESLT